MLRKSHYDLIKKLEKRKQFYEFLIGFLLFICLANAAIMLWSLYTN